MDRAMVKDALLSTSSNGLCKIYRGRYYHWPCVIKELSYQTPESFAKSLSEISAQQALSHEKICKIYNHFYDKTTMAVVIVLEPLESDMEKEISQRAEANVHWDESEIWWYLGWLTAALAYAQGQGIAHRDICPANIFLAANKDVKIGDFGSAKILSCSMTSTLCVPQVPYFASPELKRQILGSGPDSSLQYNPFQSDVYSLGLTVLNMILLEPSTELLELDTLESTTCALIGGLSVSEALKAVLREMLRVDNRCDFLQLTNLLASSSQPPQQVPDASSTDAGEIDLEALASMLAVSELQREALEVVFSNHISCSFSLTVTRICPFCDSEFQVDLKTIHNEFESLFDSPVCMEKSKTEEKKIQPRANPDPRTVERMTNQLKEIRARSQRGRWGRGQLRVNGRGRVRKDSAAGHKPGDSKQRKNQ